MVLPGDFCVRASSVRLPLVAAGLINSAVGTLLQQLSIQFFELALIQDSAPKENESSLDRNDVPSTSHKSGSKQCRQEASRQAQCAPAEFCAEIDSCASTQTLQSSGPADLVSQTPVKCLTDSPLDISPLDKRAAEQANTQTGVFFQVTTKQEQDNSTGWDQPTSSAIVIKPEDSVNENPDHQSVGCDEVLPKKPGILRHVQQNTTRQPYRCGHPGCSERFITFDALEKHSEVHLEKKEQHEFVCSHPGCGRTCSSKDDLAHHATAHADEPLFNCDHPGCRHRFFFHRNLIRHQLVHLDNTQRPRFECKHTGCGRSFRYATNLVKHLNIHKSGRYRFDYRERGRQFVKKSGLKVHRSHHTTGGQTEELTVIDLDSSSSSPAHGSEMDDDEMIDVQ